MLSQPRKTKYRKQFRGKMSGNSQGFSVSFGEFGLKALERSWISPNQIESARRTITHFLKRKGRIWIRVFPDKPFTQKGAGAPLGAGKGDVAGYVAVVRPGKVIFEVGGVPEVDARRSLELAAYKLPIKTKIVAK